MLSFKSILKKSQVLKGQLPVINKLCTFQQKQASSADHLAKYGQGGRNSFNGIVATVFGATGYLGRYVVNRLARSGAQVIVAYRGVEDDFRHLRVMGEIGQINFLHFDLKDYESILKAMSHSNTVINLISRNYSTRNFSMEECLVYGAERIANAAAESEVKQLIHMSALNAKGSSPSTFLQAKARSERKVAEQFHDATIMRPAEFYGHEDRYFNKYAYLRKLPLGVPLVKGGWQTTRRPVFVSDVARGVVKATGDWTTKGKTYELYGPEEYYLHDILSYIFRMIRKPLRVIPVPEQAFSLAGWAGEMTFFSPKLTRDMVVRQFLSEEVNDDAYTFEDLGITPANMNVVAPEILRRHRDYYHFDQIVEESEYCKPVSAYE
ncbi:NADH dehydrogenase [ubiquinone] 1 alpha subcomplex subunit 9, mitochondrial-like isoform X1 [Hydractinia symbiolongicarpus]|uniref:NADH dehydrogenase [ubiquinone] 1 alpha subcomplex subunit 9, mitochondrial-like isoform X1 n=1 Tax=Hydractinia symbiolongicarpus TaxID=13093 RepID=UPI00254F7319|nr:NADH dehydrogenase [ubiquinone] 1 alpha subcomplex subunit 9, mitochondrial-like isoform X1 [Hydractinia symbiolongicarpus]